MIKGPAESLQCRICVYVTKWVPGRIVIATIAYPTRNDDPRLDYGGSRFSSGTDHPLAPWCQIPIDSQSSEASVTRTGWP